MLLHNLHRGLHFVLPALLTAFYLLADGLKELWILGYERGHLLTLVSGHILQLPLGVLIEKKSLYRHPFIIRLVCCILKGSKLAL